VARYLPLWKGLRPWAWLGPRAGLPSNPARWWTSTHYAALACPEFPTCHGGEWWPRADFADGFSLWRPVGWTTKAAFGRPRAHGDTPGPHRAGALAVLLYLGGLVLVLVRRGGAAVHRRLAMALAAALVLQVGLGIANVVGQLPLGWRWPTTVGPPCSSSRC